MPLDQSDIDIQIKLIQDDAYRIVEASGGTLTVEAEDVIATVMSQVRLLVSDLAAGGSGDLGNGVDDEDSQ